MDARDGCGEADRKVCGVTDLEGTSSLVCESLLLWDGVTDRSGTVSKDCWSILNRSLLPLRLRLRSLAYLLELLVPPPGNTG